MAFTTGTATDYHDLLDKLRLWLTGTAGWTQLAWTAPAGLTDTATLWVRGPGAGPDRQVFIGIKSANDLSLPAYGWEIRGAINYDGGLGFSQQQGGSPAVFFNTWDSSIPYWFYANDRRFIVVAKVSSTYQSMYAGFMLPFALPSEYPFPLFLGASYPTLATFDVANTRNRMFIDPGDGAAYYRRRTTSDWKIIVNHETGSNASEPDRTVGEGALWPHSVTRLFYLSGNDWAAQGFNNLRPTGSGEMPIWQCHIIDPDAESLVGALDGAFATPGFNRATEQTVTADGRTFKLFQNVFRSTGRDFFLIEEI